MAICASCGRTHPAGVASCAATAVPVITVPVAELEQWVMTAYLAGKGAAYKAPPMRIMWAMCDGLWTPSLVPK